MKRASGRVLMLIVAATLMSSVAHKDYVNAQEVSANASFDQNLFQHWSWRSIGPILGGRSIAAAGSVSRPLEYYFGATGGGLWKTTDGGTTWDPVSDGYFRSASVGSIAQLVSPVAQADPKSDRRTGWVRARAA